MSSLGSREEGIDWGFRATSALHYNNCFLNTETTVKKKGHEEATGMCDVTAFKFILNEHVP